MIAHVEMNKLISRNGNIKMYNTLYRLFL